MIEQPTAIESAAIESNGYRNNPNDEPDTTFSLSEAEADLYSCVVI